MFVNEKDNASKYRFIFSRLSKQTCRCKKINLLLEYSKMSQWSTFFISVLLIFSSRIVAQEESDWCADSPSSPEIDPNWSTIPTEFEILAELVADNKATEITQAFSPSRDSIYKNSARGIHSFIFIIISLNSFLSIFS